MLSFAALYELFFYKFSYVIPWPFSGEPPTDADVNRLLASLVQENGHTYYAPEGVKSDQIQSTNSGSIQTKKIAWWVEGRGPTKGIVVTCGDKNCMNPKHLKEYTNAKKRNPQPVKVKHTKHPEPPVLKQKTISAKELKEQEERERQESRKLCPTAKVTYTSQAEAQKAAKQMNSEPNRTFRSYVYECENAFCKGGWHLTHKNPKTWYDKKKRFAG